MSTKRIQRIVSRWDSSRVLFECEIPDDVPSGMEVRHALEKAVRDGASLDGASLDGASLRNASLDGASLDGASLDGASLDGASLRNASLDGASLDGASLDGASLLPIKTDFFDVLIRAPREVAGLRAALVAGRVDGSTYEGECACLVGTIANVRGASYVELGNGITPNASRPVERFFSAIKKGDTPDTNGASKIVLEWVDEFTALLANAREAA